MDTKYPWREFDHIPVYELPGRLYLGGWEDGEEGQILIQNLISRDISLIIGVGFITHPALGSPLRAVMITRNIEDYQDQAPELQEFINHVLPKIYEALEKGENVYVHCHAGISRSSTVVMAYLMKYHEMSYDEALGYVRQFRPAVHPNPGFSRMLCNLENELKEK